jgi:predicted choloylglycine hydrolase
MIHSTLSGSPYEIGYQHGQQLRALVDALARYESRRHSHVPSSAPNHAAVATRVRRVAPALLEELEGIADGSGVPFEDLLRVNLQVLHYCTVIAFTNSDVGPLLGKNLDFPAYAYQVLFTVQPKEGYAMTHIGCAGSVASYGGINAAGLAMGHAVVPLNVAPNDDGLPVAFLRRLALQHSATVPEAITLLRAHKGWRAGDNVLFVDRDGQAAVVELSPDAPRVIQSGEGSIWCVNCFAHPDLTGTEEARQRYRHIEQALKVERPPLTRELMHRLLCSHAAPPLCRDTTQLSFVAYPASGRLQVADGYPCQVGYMEVETCSSYLSLSR